MPATRTQVYFSQEQPRRLDERAKQEGRSLAELEREAVHAYLTRETPDLRSVLDETYGTMPDLTVPARSEWDR